MFVFGAQYLRGMTPAPQDWPRDMKRMKELGFNTIRAWLVWNCLERREGEVDTDFLHRFLDVAGENGLRVGFLFHLHAAPEWMTKKYPHYWYVNARGERFEPAVRPNTPSGGWPGLCFDNAEVRQMERRFMETVVNAVKERRELMFWEPMNEPHQWVDLEKSPPGHYCFCEATRERFRAWLERKYGDAAALSQAWGRPMNDFSEARPPTWRFGYTDAVDFRQFTIDSVADEVHFRASVIRALDSNHPVIAHAWGGGTVTCHQVGAMAFDDWVNAQSMDMWGYSAFPADARHNVMLGLGTDATRSAGGGKTIWQSELSAGDVGAGLNRSGRVPPRVLASWSWEAIRHGAKGLLYWQYRKEAHGTEHAFPGLTDYDGGDTENLLEASLIGKTLQDNERLFAHSRVPKADVALLFSMRGALLDWCEHRSSELSIDSLSGYYRAFWEQNIPVDIVHEDFIADGALGEYKLVITPVPWSLSCRALDQLKGYVQAGGTLLSDPYFCGFDGAFQLSAQVPGAGFAEVFGCREKDMHSAKGRPLTIHYNGVPLELPHGRMMEIYRDVRGEVLATYEDGAPAIAANRYGQGRAILSGFNLGLANSPRVVIGDDFYRHEVAPGSSGASGFVLDVARRAGVRPGLSTGSRFVQASILENDQDSDVLIAINLGETGQAVCVPFTGPAAVDLQSGEALDVADGALRFALEPLQTRVAELKKEKT